MTARQVLEAEIRSLTGEGVSTGRLVSESTGPLTGSSTRHHLVEAIRALQAALALAERLP